MVLKELIEWLESQPADAVVRFGFSEPHSYRGYYDELAFDPAKDVTIGSMLAYAKSAVNQTFGGWKGGEYTMSEYTDCWISYYGHASGDRIGVTHLLYWEADVKQSTS